MQVVLYDQNSVFHKAWSEQFVKHDPLNRKREGMNGMQTPDDLVATIVKAAGLATGAELIFAVGHGGATTQCSRTRCDPTSLAEGTVDLAPGRKLRLSRGTGATFADPFYDWTFHRPGLKPASDKDTDTRLGPNGADARLKNWARYQKIATAMRTNNVYRVVFLTCNVGNATNFIKKIALDWNTLVRAYTRFVWFVGVKPTRVCLDGDQDSGPTNTPESAHRLPQVDFITVGPPLPKTK